MRLRERLAHERVVAPCIDRSVLVPEQYRGLYFAVMRKIGALEVMNAHMAARQT
jgi:hypothetical protein